MCFQPFAYKICISLMRQKSPLSCCLVSLLHFHSRWRTTCSLNMGFVNNLNTLFFQTATQISKGDMTASGEFTASNAGPLYPTLTLELRNTPLVSESGLSAWMRQHSDASTCDVASESGMPRKRSGELATNGSIGIATRYISTSLTLKWSLPTHAIPTRSNRHWQEPFRRIPRHVRSEVRPSLHDGLMTPRISQSKGVVELWGLCKVH